MTNETMDFEFKKVSGLEEDFKKSMELSKSSPLNRIEMCMYFLRRIITSLKATPTEILSSPEICNLYKEIFFTVSAHLSALGADSSFWFDFITQITADTCSREIELKHIREDMPHHEHGSVVQGMLGGQHDPRMLGGWGYE